MDTSFVSAASALVGAAIGGSTSVLASWLTQRGQAKAQWLAQDYLRRQELYRDFIEEASRCYADALQHDKPDISVLVSLFAKVNRMRVMSEPQIVDKAEGVARIIVDTYLEPDKDFVEMRAMLAAGSLDILAEFSNLCRVEFESIKNRHAIN